MVDISAWMEQFLKLLDATFAKRVWFVGLQGSYARGEATSESDIDVVVILDELNPADIGKYNAMLDGLPHRELACGFLSGRNELLHWDAADLFQFYYDTRPMVGSLDEILMLLDADTVGRAIHMAACNIYHGCVHNMLHDKSKEILYQLYKAASFAVQAVVFQQTGTYIRRQSDLLAVADAPEKEIVETFLGLKQGAAVDYDAASQALFHWAKAWIKKAG